MNIPTPNGQTSLRALRAFIRERSVMAALEVFADELGSIFRFTMPGFNPVMLVGPEAARFVLVSDRRSLRWRNDDDPVTLLLRHGVLVEDGASHDALRRAMNPALHKQMLNRYTEAMLRCTDAVTSQWAAGNHLDMLVEMRRIALLILTDTLFKVDFSSDMRRMWNAVLKMLAYISPGIWIFWRDAPRPGYAKALRQMDDYLYQIIRARRQALGTTDDMLGHLIAIGMDDSLIRDQLLTMLIAGHDTSTALLSWTLYLLGQHPDSLRRVQEEVDAVIGEDFPNAETVIELRYLEQVIEESLRLYPPIHLGSRVAADDLDFQGHTIPAGTRVMYSIYLTHRMKQYWHEPARFEPERFSAENNRQRQPYTYLPFGGGPRNCIGAAFGRIEAKLVLARILQQFNLRLLPRPVHAHMGATLEPRPGVWMQAAPR